MRTAARALLRAALLLAAAAPLGAQGGPIYSPAPDSTLDRPIRALVGGNVYYARPVGDFLDYVRRGFGVAGHGTFLVDRAGVLGLRIDASYMNYGRETLRDQCLLQTNCRVTVDVTTTNNIAFVGLGPSLVAPTGLLRPYVAGQAGWTFIWTNSSISDSDDDDELALDTENYSDNTFSYGGVAGFLIPMTVGRNPVSLDVGARYLRNGRVRYLREGDIIDNVTGPPTLDIQRSRADLVTYFVGVSVGVR